MGNTRLSSGNDTAQTGSSPRLWGTLIQAGASTIGRFIPTPVGNTWNSMLPLWNHSVHPHACGEHVGCIDRSSTGLSVHPHACGEHGCAGVRRRCDAGSSPRLWGTLGSATWALPWTVHPHACGEHRRHARRPAGHSVHPHACGEHSSDSVSNKLITGSSPRLWGTLDQPRYSAHEPVHPHACGEHMISGFDGSD